MLATTDPNPLIHRSSAVAAGVSYCWGPATQEVEVCGGEHSSACLLSEGPYMLSFELWALLRCSQTVPTAGLHMTASMQPFSMIFLYSYSRVCGAYHQRNLSNTRLKMAWFVLIFEWGNKYLDFIVEGGGILRYINVKRCPVRRSTSESTRLFSRDASLLAWWTCCVLDV